MGGQAVPLRYFFDTMGGGSLAERLNALVLKTSKGESPSGVRIPQLPPLKLCRPQIPRRILVSQTDLN